METSNLSGIEAEAKTGKVSIGEIEVTDARTLGQKLERDSKGLLLTTTEGAFYIAFPIEDIADLLTISSKSLELANLTATTPTSEGKPISALNPEIPTKIAELQKLIAEFKQT